MAKNFSFLTVLLLVLVTDPEFGAVTAWLAGSDVRPSCRREGRLLWVGTGGETGPTQPITSPPTAKTVIIVSSFNKELCLCDVNTEIFNQLKLILLFRFIINL